jgi:SAM-dependent methyltransferase
VVYPHVLERRERVNAMIDLTAGPGLEIGPLDSPLAPRETVPTVRYVDVTDQAALREHYRLDPNVHTDEIPVIDHVLTTPDGVLTLREAVRGTERFDWAIASHVIEHVPDLIGWLADLADVLEDGGRLILVVPDRRFTFDYHRQQTTVGQMLEAHDLQQTRPSVRAVFDHFSTAANIAAADAWEGVVPGEDAHTNTLAETVEMVARARAGDYVDSHVWTFTPTTFLDQISTLRDLALSKFEVVDLVPTVENGIEFYVVLRRVDRGATATSPGRDQEPGVDPLGRPEGHFPGSTRPETFVGATTVVRRANAQIDDLTSRLAELTQKCAALEAEQAVVRAESVALGEELALVKASERWRIGGAVATPAARLVGLARTVSAKGRRIRATSR